MLIKKQHFLLGLLQFCFLLLIIESAIAVAKGEQHTSNGLLWGIIGATIITAWCTIDAKERKFPLPHAYQCMIFLLAPIGWPLYLFSSRGFVGGMKFISLQIAFILALIIGASILEITLQGHILRI